MNRYILHKWTNQNKEAFYKKSKKQKKKKNGRQRGLAEEAKLQKLLHLLQKKYKRNEWITWYPATVILSRAKFKTFLSFAWLMIVCFFKTNDWVGDLESNKQRYHGGVCMHYAVAYQPIIQFIPEPLVKMKERKKKSQFDPSDGDHSATRVGFKGRLI